MKIKAGNVVWANRNRKSKTLWKTVTVSCFTKDYAKIKLHDYVIKDTMEEFDIYV